ncbi:hypothetical protein M8818_003523 [Zalaria obscura]|uniref:Uncharacterized protein n=1 Tax=Zalaria obscura TaxID=2024903 RepID=A0ACC3SF35_9PEZI
MIPEDQNVQSAEPPADTDPGSVAAAAKSVNDSERQQERHVGVKRRRSLESYRALDHAQVAQSQAASPEYELTPKRRRQTGGPDSDRNSSEQHRRYTYPEEHYTSRDAWFEVQPPTQRSGEQRVVEQLRRDPQDRDLQSEPGAFGRASQQPSVAETEQYSSNMQEDHRKDDKISRKRIFTNRVKTGCHTCRYRKKKCDEGKPFCTNCLKGNFECRGYGPKSAVNDPPGGVTKGTRKKTQQKGQQDPTDYEPSVEPQALNHDHLPVMGPTGSGKFFDAALVSIGDRCIVGPGVKFCARGVPLDKGLRQGSLGVCTAKEIVVDEDCFLGADVVVCGGVRIGRGSVVAAGCVVSQVSWTLVVGSWAVPFLAEMGAGAEANLIGMGLC